MTQSIMIQNINQKFQKILYHSYSSKIVENKKNVIIFFLIANYQLNFLFNEK